jgi:hypothetical protein
VATKALLYPFGFEFTTDDLTTKKDANHQTIMPLATAAANYWQNCQASCVITITIHDFPTLGATTIIGSTMPAGRRKDFFGADIVQTDPRKLIGAKGRVSYETDFASAMDFGSVLETGQAFGPDNTYTASYTFRGLLWFNTDDALPYIICDIVMNSNNGSLFALSVVEPATTDKVSGDFLTIDGQAIAVWFSWAGAAIPTTTAPEMTADVTTTQTMIWPS